MWDDGQIEGHRRLVRFLKQEGALAGTQITHAGRKGSTPRSFDKPGQLGPGRRRLAEMGGGRPLRAVCGRRLADPPPARHRRYRGAGAEVRRGRQARRRGGLRRHRDPRRAWLSAGAVPVADQQHAQRSVWRRPRRPHALPARGGARGAGGLAGQQADVHPRLDGRRRRRLGGRGHRRLRQGLEGAGRRRDRLFLGRPDRPVDGRCRSSGRWASRCPSRRR